MRYRITTPVPDYTGAVGGVQFVAGAADIDGDAHPAELAYFTERGYGVQELQPDTDPAPPASEDRPKRSRRTEEKS